MNPSRHQRHQPQPQPQQVTINMDSGLIGEAVRVERQRVLNEVRDRMDSLPTTKKLSYYGETSLVPAKDFREALLKELRALEGER